MSRGQHGFTLLELLTAMVVVAILSVLMLAAVESVRSRIEKMRCIGNLRTLHVAASNYVQQNGHWPQVNPSLLQANKAVYDEAWLKALEPFGAARKAWVCPTLSRSLGEPDWKTPETTRLDYAAMQFDSKQFTPFKWSSQPWFIEKGSQHGNGNLIIFPDGRIAEMNDIVKPKKAK